MRKISWFAVAATYSQFSDIADRYNSQFPNTAGWYKVALCLFGRGHHGNRHQVAHSCADCRFAWKQSRHSVISFARRFFASSSTKNQLAVGIEPMTDLSIPRSSAIEQIPPGRQPSVPSQ